MYRKRRSLTTFWVLLSKMRWWRLCQCRSRQGLGREPASRLLWLLVIATGTLDSGSSAPRKWPQPLEVPSCWLSSLSSQCAWGTGATRLVNLTLCLARYSSICRVSVLSVKKTCMVRTCIPFLTQVTGKCGSVLVRLIPAPRGTGIVSAPVPKKLLQMAGVEDCWTSARGSTGTLGNFGELYTMHKEISAYGVCHCDLAVSLHLARVAKATFAAMTKTYSYLTPDLWVDKPLTKPPLQEFTDHLAKHQAPIPVKKPTAF